MQRKTYASYKLVFKYLFELIPVGKVVAVMAEKKKYLLVKIKIAYNFWIAHAIYIFILHICDEKKILA